MTYRTRNFGDDIQTLAAMQFLPECRYFVDRDKIGSEKRDLKLIGNGWWMHGNDFPPKDNIEMFPISMHINRNLRLDWFKKNEPIGCRDLYTKEYLEKNGIKAYFSGCLTLSFPSYYGKREKRIVIVGKVPGWQKLKYPEGFNIIRERHWITEIDILNNPERRLEKAKERLELYKKSALVITSRLHVAFPCIAIGTPVILVRLKKNKDRLTGYDFIPRHKYKEITFKDNYKVKKPSKLIRELKKRVNEFVQK